MLLDLRVQNFAIIDNIHIQFQSGLNILSGETGAGKSILLKSLGLLMGEKSSTDMVKEDRNEAFIEGLFDINERQDIKERLQQLGFSCEEHSLIVRRILSKSGKNRVYINDSLSTLAVLRGLISPLIEISGPAIPLLEMTGQFENRNLQSSQYHLDTLDQYGDLVMKRHHYSDVFHKWQQLDHELNEFQSKIQIQKQKWDYLQYQKNEIEHLNLQEDEDLYLTEKIKKSKAFYKIIDFYQKAEQELVANDRSVSAKLQSFIQKMRELSQQEPRLLSLTENLSQAQNLVSDFAFDLKKISQESEGEEENLDYLEERLSQIRKLQKKHGPTLNDVLNYFTQINNEMEEIRSSDLNIEMRKKELTQLHLEAKQLAEQIHQLREKKALSLAIDVNQELKDLNMKGMQFQVSLAKEDTLNKDGLTSVEFLLKATGSHQPKPISKFASGGELSRILLSLKKVCGNADSPRTYLFDEVDTGVSGKTAEKVGKKLKLISQNQQVICVTHLPQVAAFADHHFLIAKEVTGKKTRFHIHNLSSGEQTHEIARLISGEKITTTSLAHAKELLEQSTQV